MPLRVGGNGIWNIFTKVNLTRRSDTNRINSSPVSSTAPIIRINKDCFHVINISGIII